MRFRTEASINLNAIEYNYNQIKSKLPIDAKLLAVIKADAYGNGAVQVSKFLDDKCDFFGVACIDEAIEIKRAGIKSPVLILGRVFTEDYPLVVENDVRIPIFNLHDAKKLSAEAVKQGKTIPFHFCVDTGMSRIGFQATEENANLCTEICKLPNITAEGIFSHFATADEADLTKAIAQQDLFKSFIKMLEDRGINIPIKHLNNSAGIMNFDDTFDMCRMGIILYGMYPSEEVDKDKLSIKPVLTWKTRISYIKKLEANREISYGGTYKTTEERIIATVPVGYADGYPRCLSNKGRVLVNGQYANIVGRVCMDQMMIDITDIDGVEIADEVVLIGKQGDNELTMEEVSAQAYSFNYELTCRFARRIPRVYYLNGEEIDSTNYLYK